MTSQSQKQRSDYVAGICLTALLVGAMGLIVFIMSVRSAQPSGPEYIISVPTEMGVAGIDSSSNLIYGGLVVGQVTNVNFEDNQMLVKVSLNRRLNLQKSVRIIKEDSLLGGTTNLVILDSGTDAAKTGKQLTSGEVIPITKAASGLAGILGSKEAKSIDSITDNIEQSADGLRGIVESIRSNEDISSIQDNYEALTASLQNDLPRWESSYESILERVDRIQARGDVWYDQIDQVTASADSADRAFSEITVHFREEQLEKLDARIRELVSATRAAADDFEAMVIPRVEVLTSMAEKSYDDFLALYGQMKDLAKDVTSSVDYALAQTTLASQQLTLTIDEVIAEVGIPLLQRPSQEQIELMSQYGAMNEWTRSAVQMKEILETIEHMPKLKNAGNIQEQATMARLIDLLRASLADYEAAQSKFDQVTRTKQDQGSSRRDGVDPDNQ